MTKLTIQLEGDLEEQLRQFSEESGEPLDEAVIDALRRQMRIWQLRRLQKELAPYRDKAGYESEEEFLNDSDLT